MFDTIKAVMAKGKPPTKSARARTGARIDVLLGEIDAARIRLLDLKHVQGERVLNGQDATNDTHAVRQAEEHLRGLESALAVALEQDQLAQAAEEHAKKQASIDAVAPPRAALLSLAPEWETWLATGTQLATRTVSCAAALRAAELASGYERSGSAVAEIRRQVQESSGIALHPLTGSGFVPYGQRRYPSVTACFASNCDEARR